MTILLQMILVSDKCKVTSKSHNEVFHVMNYSLLHFAFVDISHIPFANFFDIDKVKQIFIFEHLYGLYSFSRVWYCLGKIVRQRSLMVVEVGFKHITKIILVPMVNTGLMNIEQTFFYILDL